MSTEQSTVAKSYKLSEVVEELEATGHRITPRALLDDIKAGRITAFRKTEGGIWYVDEHWFGRIMRQRGNKPSRVHPDKPRKAYDMDRNYLRLLWKRYRLTPEQYQQLVDKQDGKCAICRKKPEKVNAHMNSKMHRLHVDHWHDDTTAVRGLLCGNCNWGVGRWLDNPQLLQAAVRYLNKHIPLRLDEAS